MELVIIIMNGVKKVLTSPFRSKAGKNDIMIFVWEFINITKHNSHSNL